MIFTETKLKGAFIIEVERHEDERGFFGRAWCKKEFIENGLNPESVQTSVSYTEKARTLRGLHYQIAPFSECKIVRCMNGAIFDVIIDIRPDSMTFKDWIGLELSGSSFKSIYVPAGFAHGFLSLKDDTTVQYTASQYYTPEAESGVAFDDPAFMIQWPAQPLVISNKDRRHPPFAENKVNNGNRIVSHDYCR